MSTVVLKFAIGDVNSLGLHQVTMPENAEAFHAYEEAGTVMLRARVPVQPARFRPVLFVLATTGVPIDDRFPYYIDTVHIRHTGLVIDVFACGHLEARRA